MKIVPRTINIETIATALESRVDTSVTRSISTGDLSSLGMVVPSFLTLAQFQAINGTGWVLADGGSASGTDLNALTGATTLPNLCGVWPRAKNHSRSASTGDTAGDRAIGNFLTNSVPDYQGTSRASYATFRDVNSGALLGVSQGGTGSYSTVTYDASNTRGEINFDASRSSAVYQSVTEVRVKNIAVNWFVKVNN